MNVSRLIMTLLVWVAVGVPAAVYTNGHVGVVRTYSAKTTGPLRLALNLGANFSQDFNYLKGPAPDYDRVESPAGVKLVRNPARMVSGGFSSCLGITSFLDVALSLPVYYDWAGFADVRDGGLGDLDVSVKVLYPPPSQPRVFHSAYYLSVTVPTGFKEHGLFPRHLYYYAKGNAETADFYSSTLPAITPLLLWTFDLANSPAQVPLQIHLNIGGSVSLDPERNNTAIGRLALEYAPIPALAFLADFSGESRAENLASAFDLVKDPLTISPAIRIVTPAGVSMLVGGDISISSRQDVHREAWFPRTGPSSGYRYTTAIAPTWGAHLSFGWSGFLRSQDKDNDGIPDDEDRCPLDREDIDGFEDSDGCPDPDNDGDGVVDGKDACPNDPEDRDGFKDDDGCPDPDNDGDGIADSLDKCPNHPEDFDGIDDADGCPDPDNDGDGIADSLDQCPNDPEDKDGFKDDDGCPDLDNDGDGVADALDKCPNEAGPGDNDGCPRVVKEVVSTEPPLPARQVLYGVTFKTGSVEMTFDSYQHIDPVIEIMSAHADVTVEIRGHTDSMGKYESNMRLSQLRAESVRQYMVAKGIDPGRLRAVGFGPSSPIGDNRTADGRTKNRRIEIIRIVK